MSAAGLFVAAALAASPPALDPRQEQRAHALEMEIRCVVCEGEPIGQSNADLALDMRAVVRQQIADGRTDSQIRRYFAERYGDDVLLRPPLSGATAALWAFPFAVALLAVLALVSAHLRRRARTRALAPEEP
jgi:cytochrome c-type biogenesis protein CcmH